MDAISRFYPQLKCSSVGLGNTYSDIIAHDGDLVPDQAVLDAHRLEADKVDTWRRIQELREVYRTGGVQVGTYWFHSDDSSRIQQIGLVMFGANMPANIMWKTLSGAFVLMTPALAMQIFGAVAQHDMQVFSVAEYHKQNMLVHPDPDAYDFSAGWPSIYVP